MVAGVNAALAVLDKTPLILDRADAFIGVLIDDLISTGTKEPYRWEIVPTRSRFLIKHLSQTPLWESSP